MEFFFHILEKFFIFLQLVFFCKSLIILAILKDACVLKYYLDVIVTALPISLFIFKYKNYEDIW